MRLSPVAMTRELSDEETARLFEAARAALAGWMGRLCRMDWPRTIEEMEGMKRS